MASATHFPSRPLVASAGQPAELPSGDTLPCNAIFRGTATLPALTLLLTNSTTTFTVTPVAAGDVLAVGEPITVTPGADLPGGLNIAWARVTAPNQVRIGLTSTLALALSTMPFTVVAAR